jgi:hypothetical protein
MYVDSNSIILKKKKEVKDMHSINNNGRKSLRTLLSAKPEDEPVCDALADLSS